MLKQQHFLYQRKNLYDQEPLRSSSGETAPEDDYKISWLEFLHSLPSPDFIWGSGEAASEAGDSRGGAPRWAPLQYKMEDERQKYAGRE